MPLEVQVGPQLLRDGYSWKLLNSGAIAYYAERVYMANPALQPWLC